MESSNLQQGTAEWMKSRIGRATASRFGDIMATIRSGEAASVKNYRAELVVERITGEKYEGFTSKAMEWGVETEDTARLRYELATGNVVNECGFFEHKTLLAGASPDGLISTDGLLEIKCPNPATHIQTLKSGELPKQYYWQVMGQMWITGRKWCDFVSFDPRLPANAQLFIKRVERDDSAIEDLEATVTEFLDSVSNEVQFILNYKGAA